MNQTLPNDRNGDGFAGPCGAVVPALHAPWLGRLLVLTLMTGMGALPLRSEARSSPSPR